MMTDFQAVGAFHERFDLDNVTHRGAGPRAVSHELMDFRLRFLIEELKEIASGMGVELDVQMTRREPRVIDMPAIADGLVDLNYVSLGTAHFFGLPWSQLFTEVQRANMTKERAAHKDDERSTRKSSFDVVKPKGWTAPDIAGILKEHGWKL